MESLAAILERASRPLEHARALPGIVYTDPALHDLEVERIFKRHWMGVARADELPNPGDWRHADLAGEPVVVVRGEDGVIRAHSRVCPHRSMDVLEGQDQTGSASRFTCPYHRWSFRLDGSCIGAPDMAGSAIFDTSTCGLAPIRCETWQGFVCVNLSDDGPSLAEAVAPLAAHMDPIDLTEWRLVRTLPWGVQGADWKIAIENGVEYYHHMGTHATTLQPAYPHHNVEYDVPGADGWIYGLGVVSEEFSAGTVDGHRQHPLFFPGVMPEWTPRQRSGLIVAGVYPMFFFALTPDVLTWFRWAPVGAGQHGVDICVIVPPTVERGPEFEAALDALCESINVIQTEDIAINTGQQRMAASSRAIGGPLSALEAPVWQFHRWLAAQLVPAG